MKQTCYIIGNKDKDRFLEYMCSFGPYYTHIASEASKYRELEIECLQQDLYEIYNNTTDEPFFVYKYEIEETITLSDILDGNQ